MSAAGQMGILATAAYAPRWRIRRSTIADAIGWTRGRARSGPGRRSFCNWDEDALTMSVEAAQRVLEALPADDLAALELASTSLPFEDRHHAGLLREALGLATHIELSEASGSRRAGTTALARALASTDDRPRLVCASDCVEAQAGSDAEPELGHAAAALLVGSGPVIASVLAVRHFHQDFVDQYRSRAKPFDYRLEARWIRDAGIRGQLRVEIEAALASAGLDSADVDHLLIPAPASVVRTLVRDLGLAEPATGKALEADIGLCAAAHPLLMLDHALGAASAGEIIVLVGLGQGFDVLVFRVENPPGTVNRAVPPVEEDNYVRYLGMRGLLAIDGGLRAERDNRSSQSAAFRRHAELNAFIGGRCGDCGKLQFPLAAVCIHCQARDTQSAESLARLPGEVNSFTEDWLAYTPRPPLVFGNVHFPGGANVMMEFSDVLPGELHTGQAVRMAFRIKDFDHKRGFRRYFWKPVPREQADG